MRPSVVFIFAFVLATASVGCLKIDAPNGALRCSPNPKRPCPEGYFCANDDTCWMNGSTPTGRSTQLGAPCAYGKQCHSGFCVDGTCCDSACTGVCQACNVGGGKCTTIKGQPQGNRRCPTAGFDVCVAVCDGTAVDCTYPGSSKMCGAAACFGGGSSGAVLKSATFCDGAGSCAPPDGMLTTPCPAPANATSVCAGDQCDFFCNPPYQRQGATCVPGDMSM